MKIANILCEKDHFYQHINAKKMIYSEQPLSIKKTNVTTQPQRELGGLCGGIAATQPPPPTYQLGCLSSKKQTINEVINYLPNSISAHAIKFPN